MPPPDASRPPGRRAAAQDLEAEGEVRHQITASCPIACSPSCSPISIVDAIDELMVAVAS